MLIQWCCLLLLTHFLSVHSLTCNKDTQYEWKESFKPCCKKCEPGQYMAARCLRHQDTVCETCGDGYYMDEYNNELTCNRCTRCTKSNMVYHQNCTKKSNAVCACKSGYKCNSEQVCENCIEDPPARPTTKTTTPSALPTTTSKRTSVITTTKTFVPLTSNKALTDSVWISLSLCCASVCILLTCFILISRHTPASGLAMSSSTVCCFWTSKKSSPESSQCTEEEEEVPMPVQEVCGGKTEWQEEV